MMRQTDLGATRLAQLQALVGLRQAGHIGLGGNRRLRIYGRLDCASGQRMQAANRVFFRDVAEAEAAGYRPCGHCLRAAYRAWRAGQA